MDFYDLLVIILSNITILNIDCVDYGCIFTIIKQIESLNFMQSIDSTEKSRALMKYKNLLEHKSKWGNDKVWWNWDWKTKFWPL